ncbi:MAG TPA: cyclase family protein [Acidobacteriota bacterium]|nr:cyclase family protein [Acidobacteriota bacterium]
MMEGKVEYFDISHALHEGMAVWPGDPELKLYAVCRIGDGRPANVSSFHMGTHAGTHLDAPFHLDDNGGGVADVPLNVLIGAVRVVAPVVAECIRAEDLAKFDWQGVQRVLFKTRAGTSDEESFDPGFIHLDPDAAEFIAARGILFVGTDAPSVDPFGSVTLPSHRILLGQKIAILEWACLEKVQPGDYELICLPLKLLGMDGSPVRAVLRKS